MPRGVGYKKSGGGNKKGYKVDADKAEAKRAQRLINKMLRHPSFLKNLNKQVRNMTIHPATLGRLMEYAWGKPKEQLEVTKLPDVEIIHKPKGE